MSELVSALDGTWDALAATGAKVTRRNVAGWPAYQVELLLLAETRRLRAIGEQLNRRPGPVESDPHHLLRLIDRASSAVRDAA